LNEIEFEAALHCCTQVGKFNHNLRKLITATSFFRAHFIEWVDKHFCVCVEENNLLCLLAELIEGDCIVIDALMTHISREFAWLKEHANF